MMGVDPADVERIIRENKAILGDPTLMKILMENPTFWRRFFMKTLPQGHLSGLDADTVDGLHADDFLQRISEVARTRGGGGASKFNELTDVPGSYLGESGKFTRVKATEDGLEFGAGGGGITKHIDLTDKEILGIIDHADESITNAKIVAAAGIPYSKLSLANSILNADIAAAAAIAGSKLDPATPGTIAALLTDHDLTAHALGTVVPHDALASLTEKAHGSLTGVGAGDHHPSGNILDFTLGLKTGIKAGTNITIEDDAGYAKIAASGGGAAAKTTLAMDETEAYVTGTSELVFGPLDKTFDFIKDADYLNLASLKVMLQMKVDTGYTGTVKIYIDSEGTARWTFTTTSATYELKSGTTDISALSAGLHTLTIKGYANDASKKVYLRLYHILGAE